METQNPPKDNTDTGRNDDELMPIQMMRLATTFVIKQLSFIDLRSANLFQQVQVLMEALGQEFDRLPDNFFRCSPEGFFFAKKQSVRF